jgi:Ca2+/Na+ antiporter
VTSDQWLAVVIWLLVVILSVVSIFKSIHLPPAKINKAKTSRVLDIIFIFFFTGWAIKMFTVGDRPGFIVGVLMTATVVCCVVDVFILNRYLDRTEKESRL